jgi:nitrogen fixation/metabolism regulation signal transduction histidine kinase
VKELRDQGFSGEVILLTAGGTDEPDHAAGGRRRKQRTGGTGRRARRDRHPGHLPGKIRIVVIKDYAAAQRAGFNRQELVRERLFRPFFTSKNDGNGLGLWISLGPVERYGGSIEADNAPGGGAIFRVRLLTEPQEAAAPTNNGRPLPV